MSKNPEMLRALAMMAPPATLQQTSINVTSVSGDTVGVAYSGLPGNNPGTASNFIAIFQTTSQDFPFGTTNPPVAVFNVTGNVSGAVTIPANILIDTPYVVGYAVGAKLTSPLQPYGNICATAYIPPTGSAFTSFSPSISLQDVQSTSIMCNYNLPNGVMPQTNGAWAGLWVNNDPSYAVPPTSYAPINSNAASGGPLTFNGVSVKRGAAFYIGLFMSGWVTGGVGSAQNAMAAILKFNT